MAKPIAQIHLTVAVFVLICLFALSSVRATRVKYCDNKANYVVKVSGVDISPNPVQSGKPATFKILGSSGQHIAGGKVVIKVSYFGLHVHTETHDLCEETSCPVTSGKFVLSHSQTLPSITPPGSYNLKMSIEDDKGNEMTCISFAFKITLSSLVSAA